jgi:hypothetical protein
MLEVGELSKEHLEQSPAYIIGSVVANFEKKNFFHYCDIKQVF